MSFYRRIVVPRFGGVNRLDPPELIRDDQGQIVQDVRLDRNRLEARRFRREWGPPSGVTFTSPVRFFGRLSSTSTVLDVVVSSGSLYRDYSSIGSGFSTDDLWSHFIHNGLMYLASRNAMRVVGTSSFTNWGIAKPTAAPVTVEGATGNLDGAYQYTVTFFNSDGIESEASPASTELSVDSKKIELSSIPVSSDSQVTGRYIYRIGGLVSTWFRVGTINDNITTTFSDNTADATASGNTARSVTDHDEPPNAPITVLHNGIAFYAGVAAFPNRLYYSESLFPEYSGNYRVIGGYETLKSLAVYEDELFIWKEGEIFSLQGTDPDVGKIRRLNVRRGTIASNSVAVGKFPTYIYHDGIYTHDAYNDFPVGRLAHDIFTEELNTDRLPYAVGTANRQFYVVSVPKKGSRENDMILIYNYETRDILTLDFGATALWTSPGGEIYAACLDPNASTDTYKIYVLDHDTNTFNPKEELNMKWKSKRFYMGRTYKDIGSLKEMAIVADTKSEDIEVFCHIDGTQYRCNSINSSGTTLHNVKLPAKDGFFVEIELRYSGTKRPVIQAPIIINPEGEGQQ